VACAALLSLAWWFVHSVPWAGPLVANTLRAVFGTDAVAKLEDTVYGVEDRVNRVRHGGERPKAYWSVPSGAPSLAAGTAPSASAAPGASAGGGASVGGSAAPPSAFVPKDVGPLLASWSAPGDGVWVPVLDTRNPGDSPRIWKTLLHPDPNRSWSEVFVFAVDRTRTELHPVPGYQEPKSLTQEGKDKLLERSPARPALVPAGHLPTLLAAFNGGFMAEHGKWGMMVNGVTIVDPRDKGCTLAAYANGELRIGSWTKLADTRKDMTWFRQTPPCMVEAGVLHPGLVDPNSRSWGATLDGETVIRRSAIGLDDQGKLLFFAVTNATSAKALASALQHAGAKSVAQLDVNWSYPKILTFDRDASGGLVGVAAAPGFEFDPGDYVRVRAMRDFFYLTRR
jgi:hypothetical protein